MTDRLVENIRQHHPGPGTMAAFDWWRFADNLEKYLEKNYVPKEKGMKLESVKKLRGRYVLPSDEPDTVKLVDFIDGNALADEIQAEIDKYYLPIPLYEDGEPVQFGDPLPGKDGKTIGIISYIDDGTFELDFADIAGSWELEDRVKRPPAPDTQDRIDEDASLPSEEYCKKYGLSHVTYEGCIWSKWKDLFNRQRKLHKQERDA